MRWKSAILAGCATFFAVSVCWASENNSESISNTVALQFSVAADQEVQKVRPLLNKIKPAAGNSSNKGTHERKPYWKQTVNRKRHNSLQE
nr:hypothetical protein [Desulfobulbaceae bacterium]